MTKLREELEQARAAELVVRRERQALADEKQALELEVTRTLDAERRRERVLPLRLKFPLQKKQPAE